MSVFSNFSIQKYFLGMPGQNQLFRSQTEQYIFEQKINIDSRRPKAFKYALNS